ncbi:cbb3-type cytochrome oxidase subunit 3 [Ramlibacter rhizophilus]|uniref:CcoQ/FixQ family Cbb3-type cytochrome c oxidase assembly chaperone n=1 Tax=Ramlibacter rhizophilus TaxID=1781167 RepID=A0A4Z0BCT1_9BURK|nr:cbb3-type cytochrome c oxidase subunit 3 [Ramlibacter rhizophilus]TFY96540.1 CcoQ/FixQ family Cbb3-type cytochrome c oxidase assembly chaperone [Ramlibacter rhizophilus]
MDITTLRIVATLVSLATFLAIAGWAYARRNRGRFDEAAALPFQNDE